MSSGGFLRRGEWYELQAFLRDGDRLCPEQYVERAVEVAEILARSIQRARAGVGPVSYARRELERWDQEERRELWLLGR
jgi:hypothetical protein